MPDLSATTANLIAEAALAFGVVSWGIGQLAKAWRNRGVDAAAEAVVDATVATELREIKRKLDTLTTQITKTNENHVVHEVDCAKFRGETVGELKHVNESISAFWRNLEQLRSQLRLQVAGGANKLIEMHTPDN